MILIFDNSFNTCNIYNPVVVVVHEILRTLVFTVMETLSTGPAKWISKWRGHGTLTDKKKF